MKEKQKIGKAIHVSALLQNKYGAALVRAVNDMQRSFKPQRRLMMESMAGDGLPRIPVLNFSIKGGVETATSYGGKALRSFDHQFKQSMKAVTSSAPRIAPVTETMGDFIRENVKLISSIPVKLQGQVQDEIQKAVTEGRRPEALATDIEKRFNVAKNRARLIARDQLSKLNGRLNQQRQEGLGITQYIWETSNDDRVRDLPDDSHKDMEGMLCKWDDATVYSDDGGKTWLDRSEIGGPYLHPGEDYQCRCGASPIIPDYSSGDMPVTDVDGIGTLEDTLNEAIVEEDAAIPPEYHTQLVANVDEGFNMLHAAKALPKGVKPWFRPGMPQDPFATAEYRQETKEVIVNRDMLVAQGKDSFGVSDAVHETAHHMAANSFPNTRERLMADITKLSAAGDDRQAVKDVLKGAATDIALLSSVAGDELATALRNTHAYKRLQAAWLAETDAERKLQYQQWKHPKEMFARALTQYVADRNKLSKMSVELAPRNFRALDKPSDEKILGFSPTDRVKIQRIFNKLFKQEGLR